MNVSEIFIKRSIFLFSIIIINYCVWFFYPPGIIIGGIILFVFTLISVSQILALNDRLPLAIFFVFAICIIFLSGSDAWDARSIWLFHAKRLFYEQNIFAPFDGYVPTQHPDYPAMVPSMSATLGNIVGAWNEVYPKSSVLFFLAPALLMSVVILGYSSGTILLLIAIGHYCSPHLFDGYIDSILAIYINSYILLLLFFLKSPQKEKLNNLIYILLGLVLAIISLLKNEGFFAALILFGITLYASQHSHFSKKILCIEIIALMFCIVTWKIPVYFAHLPSEFLSSNLFIQVFNRASSIESWNKIINSIFDQCWLSISIASLLLIFKRPYLIIYKPALLFCISYVTFLVFVYLATPLNLDFHLITSIDRTLIPINLILVSITIFGFRDDFLRFSNKFDCTFSLLSPLLRQAFLISWVAINVSTIYLYLESPIKLDQKISFAKNGDGPIYLQHVADLKGEGWGHPEVWGVWLSGSNGLIKIQSPSLPAPNLLKLELRPFLWDGMMTQEVEIEVGGGKYIYMLNSSLNTVFLPLDIRLPWGGEVIIKFHVNSPRAPKELGISDDERLLSIGLVSATFMKVDNFSELNWR